VTNLNEHILATASNSPDRYAFSTVYDSLAGTNTVTFSTTAGRTYHVKYSNDLLSWLPAAPAITGAGATMQWTNDGTTTVSPTSAAAKRL